MLRPPYTGHRRYSITHRAVQRLRELVPKSDDEDDETLRDRLDAALSTAEDEGKAIRTLDAMLGEPQTLIPIAAFGDLLYAIIKEDTVVTVLPQGHGEEILQRGQAMEQRVASGQALLRAPEREDERWDHRRRWRKEAPTPVVIERIVRGNGTGHAPAAPTPGEAETRVEPEAAPVPTAAVPRAAAPTRAEPRAEADPIAKVVSLPDRPKLEGPVADALRIALDRGRRRAAIAALRETLAVQHREAALLPLWNELASEGIPHALTIGDLIDAVRGAGS